MENDPQLHINLIQLLANQIEEERSKRCLAQCVNVRAKVATHLLAMMNKHARLASSATPQIDLRPISLTAQELGMARETMSRTLSKFEQAATITCQRGLISIQDAQQLQTIAAGLDCGCCQQHIHL
jgi:CRP-like cAMP-binding protein